MKFETVEQMLIATAEAIRPPERLTVSEAAARYRKLHNPGAYSGPWLNETTPQMVEPMNTLTSTEFTGMIFVGPAQSAKTDSLALNWLTYTAVCDPADFMIVQTSQGTARDFSKRRVERLFRHSPRVGSMVLPGRQNQNTYDTKFISGMLLTLSWPTINELSGKPIGRLLLTDYDRMPENIDGEGSPYDLAKKRATTFGRYGMTAAESSPGYEVDNPRWQPTVPHEAPPTRGILALYNRGDRRRWLWKCPHCATKFEPEFSYLRWPESSDKLESAEQAYMVTPCCGGIIHHSEGISGPGKYELNLGGKWIRAGQKWEVDDSIVGTAVRSDIASFWLKGVCASFADWKSLVFNFLAAQEEYEKTGSHEALKTTVNTDQGLPFIAPAARASRLPEDLKARAEDFGDRIVPDGVRFLIASIDVQKSRFVVQVHGVGEGGDFWIVDRFDVRKSKRLDAESERLPVDPASYLEDWQLLVDQVIERTYLLNDGSDRKMRIKAIGCDSGGREGVTVKAYEFWRWLRDSHPGDHHSRFRLIKGEANRNAPRVRISYPDSDRRDRRAAARGEVPVLMINPNELKDQVAGMLDRHDERGGRVNYPSWLPDWFFSELCAEQRTAQGWINPKRLRNESFDLMVYAVAICVSSLVRLEQIDWNSPPAWAKDWDENDLVSNKDEPIAFSQRTEKKADLSSLAEQLA